MIKLKGISDSMLRCVVPEDMSEADLPEAFGKLIDTGGAILPGAKVVLDFGGRRLSEATVASILSSFVWPSGISAAAWITYDAETQDLLKRAGFPTSEPERGAGSGRQPGALVLQRSLRSGQRVVHRGDVIISGHVNDGAEALASGNVTVLGRLKGVAHAGYEGDENTAVVARSMEALQVRIAGHIGSLDRDPKWWGKSVIVCVSDGAVLIRYWPTMKNSAKDESA
ncbi:MAG: septum site-determining protein MinC [Synergistaceae bacterium]|jgi:septum site-determining protein MinC|nr:septum site-determining protein MinC [Synergistaceae bacterium]